jgi:hypothetical protein
MTSTKRHTDTSAELRPGTKRALSDADLDGLSDAKRQAFLELYDFRQGRGLEFGPLDTAVARAGVDDVKYVDVFDQAGIREHYLDDPNVILDRIPVIDFPLIDESGVRTHFDAASPGAPYDWFIASHVIEHVPDVIGWLKEARLLAGPGARMLLAVPDRRHCFDAHRPATTTGQAIQAHFDGDQRPSTRAIYDAFGAAVEVDPGPLWAGELPPGVDRRYHELAEAMEFVDKGRRGEYVDCHVWTFTPHSLSEQIAEWRTLGLCDWSVEKIIPSHGTVEFFALLRATGAGDEPVDANIAESDLAGIRDDLPAWLDEQALLHARIACLERWLDESQALVSELAEARPAMAWTAPIKRHLRPIARRIKRSINR